MLSGAAIVLMAAPAAHADPTQVIGVQVSQANGGVEMTLVTRTGDRPDVFTVSRGNALIADITNTQLRLPEGNGFLQNNPAPGIASIMVTPLDTNSIRVTILGDTAAPTSQVAQRANSIVLSAIPAAGSGQAAAPVPAPPTTPSAPVAQQPAPTPPLPPVPGANVMVPNPQVSIDGVPATSGRGGYTPPLQPRAIAPSLGDIAISNLDTSPPVINLDTAERVPRLVLRDAPVRDVLSLLARAAGLNVAYVGNLPATGAQQAQGGAPAAPGQGSEDVKVSLDIENEAVQDVFNYVLRVSGLEANRTGRTIFVGPRLPDDARGVVARSLRLNQVAASDAANFLTSQGAETQIARERVEVSTFGEGAAARTVENRTPEILALRATEGTGPLLLRGLAVSVNERLNTVTLVGTPRKVEMATALLQQLDLRRRQVAVNVRVVDVNLLATEDFNTSFSFGIDNNFFSSDGGAATFNFGGVNPPSRSQINNSQLSPPVTQFPVRDSSGNPLTAPDPFVDAQPNAPFGVGDPQSTSNPPLNDGSVQIPGGTFIRPPFGTNSNPLQGGVTRVSADGTLEVALPQLFQFPTRFLAALQTQIVSGNAKILTDPTLTVQEGQRAQVRLTQEVFGGFEVSNNTLTPIIKNAGLTLDIIVDRIDDNGFVNLSVQPTVSSIANTFNTQQGAIVLLQERAVQSGLLRIRDGQTLILSGIIQDSDRATVTKIPILGDIPLLGALFRSTERSNSRQEVIVLVTPQVVSDSDLSNFGYEYTPGRETQQFLQRRGIQFP